MREAIRLGEERAGDLTLDLGALRTIDCGGIGLLLLCRQAAARRGARLRVTGATGPIRTMLALSGLLGSLEAGGRTAGPAARQRQATGQDVPLLLSA